MPLDASTDCMWQLVSGQRGLNGRSFILVQGPHDGVTRSVREFAPTPVPRPVLERLLEAATTAPSNTNRQPWRFAVVTAAATRAAIADAVRTRADEIRAIIARGHHADDYGSYGDFFHEPLAAATVIVVPQYREYPDLIANFIASGGGDPTQYPTASAMQAELCSTCAAVMTLLIAAHALALDAVLVTANEAEFARVAGLRVENWILR